MALEHLLLQPISHVPPAPFVAAAFDEPSDAAVEPVVQQARAGDVLVFDGIFLQRAELRDAWDLTIFVDGLARVTAMRVERASAHCPVGPAAWVHLAWWWAVLDRYVGGQRLYLDEADPVAHADIVVDNNDWAAPRIVDDPTLRGVGSAECHTSRAQGVDESRPM